MRILVLCPHNLTFKDISKACFHGLIELGHEVKFTDHWIDGYDIALFMVFHHPWQNIPHKTNTLKIGYHMEPLPWKSTNSKVQQWFIKFKKKVKDYDIVFDTSKNNVDWLRRQGYSKVLWCAMGYSSIFELVPSSNEKHYSISMIGAASKRSRRSRIINRLQYLNKKIRIHTFQNIYGTELANVIHNTDIHLNLHTNRQSHFEFFRITLLLSNRQFVLSEKTHEYHPFKHKEHLFLGRHKYMNIAIKHYLNDSKSRQQIAENGYTFLKDHFSWTSHLGNVLEEIKI